MSTDRNLRAAMVGLRHGHMGRLDPKHPSPGYIHSFKQIEGVEVVAYCEDTDPHIRELAKAFDPEANVYSSVDDLIAQEEFDFAVVVLPANEVVESGIKLAQAGKHFFMEKQLARTAKDLAGLVRVVQQNNIVCQAGYPWRFHPAMADLRRFIEGGTLGQTLSIAAQMVTTQVRTGARDPKNFLYTNAEEGGGILHMLGGHYLELMRFLVGCDVKSVQAMTGRPVGHIDEPLEDVAIAVLEYEDGTLGSIHSGYLQPAGSGGYSSALAIWGMEGFARWPSMGANELTVMSNAPEWNGAPQRTFEYTLNTYEGYGSQKWFLHLLQGFVDTVRSGGTPAVTADDGLRVLQVIEAAYESAQSGRRVELVYDLV